MKREIISVKVRVEGSYPSGEVVVELPNDATLKYLLDKLGSSKHRLSEYLFDSKTGKPAVRLALVNDRSVLQQDFERVNLNDGDKVFFILPVSGG